MVGLSNTRHHLQGDSIVMFQYDVEGSRRACGMENREFLGNVLLRCGKSGLASNSSEEGQSEGQKRVKARQGQSEARKRDKARGKERNEHKAHWERRWVLRYGSTTFWVLRRWVLRYGSTTFWVLRRWVLRYGSTTFCQLQDNSLLAFYDELCNQSLSL
jgi:hypothetical protein